MILGILFEYELFEQGLPKKPESFIGALKALLKVCRTKFGCVRVDFCQPFSLKVHDVLMKF